MSQIQCQFRPLSDGRVALSFDNPGEGDIFPHLVNAMNQAITWFISEDKYFHLLADRTRCVKRQAFDTHDGDWPWGFMNQEGLVTLYCRLQEDNDRPGRSDHYALNATLSFRLHDTDKELYAGHAVTLFVAV